VETSQDNYGKKGYNRIQSGQIFDHLTKIIFFISNSDLYEISTGKRARNELTTKRLREWDDFTTNYKAIQLLVSELNESICFPLLAEVLASVMALHVMILVSLLVLANKIALLTQIILSFVQGVIICVYFVFVYKASITQENLQVALQEKKEGCSHKYQVAFLRSLPPIHCAIGHFARMEKLFAFTVLDIVVNATVDVVIGITTD